MGGFNARKKELRLASNDVVPVVAKVTYDFAVDGGAQGAITLTGEDGEAVVIPAGSLITRCWKSVTTTLAGASSTWMFGVTSDTDAFLGATPFDNAANVGVDAHAAGIPQVQNTRDQSIIATIAGANATAGAFDLFVEYVPPLGARTVARS